MKNLEELTETNNELLQIETTCEEIKPTSSNKEIFEVEQIENTPFSVVKQNDEYIGCLGQHKITEKSYTDKEECIKETTEITWERIQQVLWVVVQKFNTEK